ncbi:MAG: alpha-1,2-fucosyltransferase [Bacteroidota bacterium]
MIIISNKTGQLANRLFAFSHVIANSIEHDIAVLNLNFDEYKPYFEATRQNDFGTYKIRTQYFKNDFLDYVFNLLITTLVMFLGPILGKGLGYEMMLIKEDSGNEVDLNSPTILKKSQKKYVFLRGWGFWDQNNLSKHGDEIRELFQLVSPYKDNVERLIRDCKEEVDVLIGLHIRAGDYRHWQGGKYFYETEHYVAKARELDAEMSKEGKRVGFVICSNEAQDLSLFEGLQVFSSTDHFIEDLYTLSNCDYILGPPSTYSLWASFHGKTPYLHMETADQEVKIENFKIKAN